jgi:hypothetical protein
MMIFSKKIVCILWDEVFFRREGEAIGNVTSRHDVRKIRK